MSFPEINKIKHVLKAICDLTGFIVIWKTPSGGPPWGIPLSQSIHCCEFCSAVQKNAQQLSKCQYNDDTLLPQKAKSFKRPFLNTCHTGVTELVVPLFDKNYYYGSFIFGIARTSNAICPYSSLLKKFNELPVYDENLFNSIQTILEYLSLAIVEYYTRLKRSSTGMANDEKIRKSQYFIMTNYSNKFDAAEVATYLKLSTSRFLHLFKEKTDETFTAYTNKIRMENAIRMLLETDYKIIQIAYEVSFNNESYFCSIFKKHTGMSPNKYRQKFKK